MNTVELEANWDGGAGSEYSCSSLISSPCALANPRIFLPSPVSPCSTHVPAHLNRTAKDCCAALFLSGLALLLEVLLNNGRKWDYWEEFVCFANCKWSVCFFSLPYPPGHPGSSVFFLRLIAPEADVSLPSVVSTLQSPGVLASLSWVSWWYKWPSKYIFWINIKTTRWLASWAAVAGGDLQCLETIVMSFPCMVTCSGFFPIFAFLCLILTLWNFNHVISLFKLCSENLTSNRLHLSHFKFNKLISGLNIVQCMLLLFAKNLPSKSTLQIWEKRFCHNQSGFCLLPTGFACKNHYCFPVWHRATTWVLHALF